ncbi:MAG: 16S rRNA (cytosine(967)-C(5))-methyltransferase RsmB [Blautia sp.]|nr:16S rRNA (cytosine(967)-C(5))-methyltransferase RsmB [Blautia sp.]
MTNGINTRELIVDILLKIDEEGEHSHIALGNVLAKYQFLPKQDRAFITRVVEGTLEYRIRLDYIINAFSRIRTEKMKPVIREILRSAVYQMIYMDSVPDPAACNEAVSLTQKRGFYNLKPFVNGVLRTLSRDRDTVVFPSRDENLVLSLSVQYSMPEELVERWLTDFGEEKTEKILADFLTERETTVRCRGYSDSPESVMESMRAQGAVVTPAPYLPYACRISGYDHLYALDAFVDGRIMVQDVSSMLAAQAVAPRKGDYIIDMCAAPGGKSIHLGDMMEGYGTVDARDISDYKIGLIEENIARTGVINVQTRVQDAAVFDVDSEISADVVLADVPCSGYGVIGRKPEIKYRMTRQRQEELILLQRQILDRAADYVKPRGVLVFSTCTIAVEENEDNMLWFLQNHPFILESLDPYIPQELHCESTSLGYLQLLPGIHGTDGFFMARFRRK